MTNSRRVVKTMSRKTTLKPSTASNNSNGYRSEREKKHDRSHRVNRRNWGTSTD